MPEMAETRDLRDSVTRYKDGGEILTFARTYFARAEQNPKISYHLYLRLPPHPPPQGGKFERKEIFDFTAAALFLQKGS